MSSPNITDVEVVASYNWLDGKESIILVPGMPPSWSPPSDAPEMKPDSGWLWIDENAFRRPKSPIEPLLRAVLHEQPEFNFGSIDIISDRHPLSCLLNLAGGDSKAFAFAVQVVGDTVILTRESRATREFLSGNKFKGFRKTFEATYMKHMAEMEGSTSHRRIISYSFGSMRLLVRYAADASFSTAPSADQSKHDNPTTPDPAVSDSNKVTVRAAGHQVLQSDIVELTTRGDKKGYPEYETKRVPDLWLAQTPNFVTASSTTTSWNKKVSLSRSVFKSENISVRKSAEDVAKWETENGDLIVKFHELLKTTAQKLRDAAAGGEVDGLFMVEHAESAKDVSITPYAGATKLPEDLYERVKAKQ